MAAAVEHADREGLSGLTTRPVGDRLGVEGMSHYHYLPGKDAARWACRRVMAEVDLEVSATTQGTARTAWLPRVRDRCLGPQHVMVRHPGRLPFSAPAPRPPRVYVHYEAVLDIRIEAASPTPLWPPGHARPREHGPRLRRRPPPSCPARRSPHRTPGAESSTRPTGDGRRPPFSCYLASRSTSYACEPPSTGRRRCSSRDRGGLGRARRS
jgi:AcrR family transcriptional regulator